MDSGMDSGLGITQELTSASDVAPAAEPRPRSPGCLPESAERRLVAILDGPDKAWRELAQVLELDVSALEQRASPTAHILRCVKKYDNLSLEYLAKVLQILGQDEAHRIVRDHAGQ
ncbi:uncharacterized protein LOC119090544 [Pollicipes pollicipes]|uniref:uncharacterized protein LOC119090544 n=1 Tax=Pollicipes pollicipes TaxID=41117 RepID=UPI001884D146|nr:uncharacterized protein LOC119090544 [Pollicipes pollicipes]